MSRGTDRVPQYQQQAAMCKARLPAVDSRANGPDAGAGDSVVVGPADRQRGGRFAG